MQLKTTDTYSCGCGRSPTGQCIGWHGLTDDEYQKRLAEYQKQKEEQK
jgi:hypothetical protein